MILHISSHQKRLLIIVFTLLAFISLNLSAAYAQSLTLNSRGTEVTMVQQKLKELGYNIKKITGVFDNSTKRAVLAFQRDNKIKISGVVDDKTMAAIKAKTPSSPAKVKADNQKDKPAVPEKSTIPESKPALKNQKVPESQPFLPRSKVPAILKTAKKYIGTPYASGGNSPKGFDCSGYVQYVFSQNGIDLPRTADVQYGLGKKSSPTTVEAGDLVFFHTDSSSYVTHCGIYLGKGQFIHASSSKGIRIDELSNEYWKKAFVAAKHIIK